MPSKKLWPPFWWVSSNGSWVNLPRWPIVLRALLYSVFGLLLQALVDRHRDDAEIRLELLVFRHRRGTPCAVKKLGFRLRGRSSYSWEVRRGVAADGVTGAGPLS